MQTDPLAQRLSVIAEIECALGARKLQLRPCDSILTYSITDWRVVISVRVPQVVETRRETRYVGAVIRMMIFSRPEFDYCAPWSYEKIEVPDPDFVPYTDHMMGRIESPAEYAERRRWEGDQYRVGVSRFPMDSAARAAQGYSPMESDWLKG